MSTVTMDMNAYEIERDDPPGNGYCEELICPGFDPGHLPAVRDVTADKTYGRHLMPADLSGDDRRQLEQDYLFLSFE